MKTKFKNYLNIIAWLIAIFFTGEVLSQNYDCEYITPETTTEELARRAKFRDAYVIAVTNNSIDKTTEYYVPVIIHEFAKRDSSFISDETVFLFFKYINENFANPLGSDTKIRFVPATVSPNGSCYNGIERISVYNPNFDCANQSNGQNLINSYKWTSRNI